MGHVPYDRRDTEQFIKLCEDAGVFMDPVNRVLHCTVLSEKAPVDPMLEKEITRREPQILQYFADLAEESGLAELPRRGTVVHDSTESLIRSAQR